jgi:UDP-glucose 4-epimerase
VTEAAPAVLVTGGAGYIGSHAVLALLEAGYGVVVLDNLSTGRRALVAADADFVEGDVGDTALLDRLLPEKRIAAVLHFAGSIIVPESVEKPLLYYRNNTIKTQGLIEACVRHGVRHFIFSSTAAVYGTPDRLPVGESVPPRPINPYGTSKLMSEWVLRDTAAAHDLDYVALRYFNVAGADPAGRTGQATPAATHLIKVACETALGHRDHVAVFGDDYPTPDGTGIRDYIHVTDLVAAHVLALDHLRRGGDSLVMNCGYGHGFSVREVLATVERAAGRPFDIRNAPRRAGDPAALVADASLIRRQLDWHPRFDDLDTIVETALAWEMKFRQGM